MDVQSEVLGGVDVVQYLTLDVILVLLGCYICTVV
jgi:hypothetical protein